MDPWPQQKKEPKAPDKNIETLSDKDSNIIMKIKPETPYNNCGKTDSYSPRVLASNKDTSVSSLNEPDLKALLEEAMAYKRPKDIQGKSDLFKELLHSVEAEKKFTVLSRPEKQSNRRPRRKQVNKKEIDKTTHESPYQDLIVHVSECDTSTNKRHVKYSVKCSSSNVPQIVPVNAVAACDENNPEISTLLQNGSFDTLQELQKFVASEANVYQIQEPVDSNVGFPLNINSYAEKCEDDNDRSVQTSVRNPVSSLKEITDLTLANMKDNTLAIEAKKSLDENGNSVGTSSRMDSLAERKAKARRIKAKNDKNTILSQHIEGHRSDIVQDIDALMKYIESPKLDRSKSTRSRNVLTLTKHGSRIARKVRDKSSDTLSRKVQKLKEDTLQKSSSLEEISISKFEDLTKADIPDDNESSKKYPVQEHESWKSSAYFIKSNDMSRKEATTSRIEKQEEVTDADFLPVTKKTRKKKNLLENQLRTKCKIVGDVYPRCEKSFNYLAKSQELDHFHPSNREFSSREFQRRKSISSVPSSDKSADTSDLDSVHSFPVSSNKGRGLKTNVSASIGSTPQISYADIARSVRSPIRIMTMLNAISPKSKISPDTSGTHDDIVSSLEPIPTVIVQLPPKKEVGTCANKSKEENSVTKIELFGSSDDYPPLDTKVMYNNSTSSSDMFVEYTVVVPKRKLCPVESNCVSVEETVLIEMPPTKSDIPVMESINVALNNQLPTKRPPVILMHNNVNDSIEVTDLIFGFEVNEQLLNNADSETFKQSDIVYKSNSEDPNCARNLKVDQDTSETEFKELNNCMCDQSSFDEKSNVDEIVSYIQSEWDSVLMELTEEGNTNKVKYFCPD